MTEPVTHSLASQNLPQWQLQEAKNRFSAVVKAAASSAQLVTVHGQAAAVVLSPQDYERLIQCQAHAQPLSERLACPVLDDDEQVLALFRRDHSHNPARDLPL